MAEQGPEQSHNPGGPRNNSWVRSSSTVLGWGAGPVSQGRCRGLKATPPPGASSGVYEGPVVEPQIWTGLRVQTVNRLLGAGERGRAGPKASSHPRGPRCGTRPRPGSTRPGRGGPGRRAMSAAQPAPESPGSRSSSPPAPHLGRPVRSLGSLDRPASYRFSSGDRADPGAPRGRPPPQRPHSRVSTADPGRCVSGLRPRPRASSLRQP